jgi:hypothetical protein
LPNICPGMNKEIYMLYCMYTEKLSRFQCVLKSRQHGNLYASD